MAIKDFDCGVRIGRPIQFDQRRKGAIHLLIDPSGDDLFVGVFQGATDAVLAAEGFHAEQGSDVGVATMADEDGLDEGGEDFFFGRCVGTGASQQAGIDEFLPGVTYFQEVDEVNQTSIAGDGGGGVPASFDGATKGVDWVGRGEVSGVRGRFTF